MTRKTLRPPGVWIALLLFAVLAFWSSQRRTEPQAGQPQRVASRALPSLPPSLGNADDRERNSLPQDARIGREQAVDELRQEVPGLQVEFDEITGGPKHVASPRAFLTTAAAGGPDAVVPRFVGLHRALFGHGAAALEPGNSRITRRDVTPHNGMETWVWQQELDGIPFFQTVLRASVTKKGELITIGSNFLSDPVAASRKDATARASLIAEPPVKATRAVVLAAADLDAEVDEATVIAAGGGQGVERRQEFQVPALSDTRASLAWVPISDNEVRLAWDVILTRLDLGEMFRVLVDAEDGEVLVRHSLTDYISDASYRVYARGGNKQPYDSPMPFSPGHATPSAAQPPVVARELVTLDAQNVTASPDGWIADGGTQTLGNNVDAHTDTNSDNSPDLPRPTSATRNFDFPIDFATAPSGYRDAAVTQLFYMNNWIHDQLYALGFTESAGNFQTNNFGRGGAGNDAVQADAQDGSGTNNANFSTPPDGSPGRMQMYVFTGPTPDIDGDFDAEIVIHEYVHGLSNRLVGGGVGMTASQSRGMGEGWSDFYGLALLSEPADDLHANYAAGGYATRQFSGLAENYYFGIRRYPYSTNLLKNPLTFKDISSAQASTHPGIPRSPLGGSTADEVHNQGEVWCVALWEMRANLITRHGFATGNALTLQLVTDGMKLAPVNPNFIQARDGILQADLVNHGGANRNELWTAFAKRGMGASATSPSSSSTVGLVESFEIPDHLAVSPFGTWDALGQVGGSITPAARTFALLNGGTTPLNWTASRTQPWLSLSATGGSLAAGASTTVTASFNAAAGVLLLGTYADNITFTNATSGATIVRPVSLTMEPLYETVFSENFESGSLRSEWAITGTATHRTQVTTVNAPHGGAYHLTMDSTTSSTYARNEATLTLNLAGRQNLVLNFWVKMFSDEAHAPATNPFTGGADFDGIAVSADGGTTWHEIRDLRTITAGWQKITVDLDAAVAARGLSYNSNFKIRFNHYDNYPIATDGFAFDDILVAEALENALFITTAATATEGDGPLTATLSVVPLQTEDLPVTLATGSPEVTLPPGVVIPAGAGAVEFTITPVNDALLDGSQIAQVTASVDSFSTGSASVTIHDNETATLTVDLPESVDEGSSPSTGTVTASAPVGRDVAVALASESPSLQFPATVVIPAGATSALFSVTLVNDGEINGSRPATIAASMAGWTGGSDTMTILDDEVSEFALSVSPMREGDAGKLLTITFSGTLPADLTVSLTSSDTSAVTVPDSFIVPAGKKVVVVPLGIVDDPAPDGAQAFEITVTAMGFPNATVAGTVQDNDAHHFTISPLPATVLRNEAVAVSVAAKDINDVIIGNYSQTVSFTAGTVPLTPASSGAFVDGVLDLNLTFTGYATGVVLTVADSGGTTGTSNVFDIVAGDMQELVWSAIPSPQHVDAPFPVTLRAVDRAGNPVTSFSGTAALSAGASGTVEVLSWTAYADVSATGEYALTKQALASHFTSFHETTTTVTQASELAAALVGKQVFLIVEQESSNATILGSLGTEWNSVLNDFVNGGGTVIACSNTTSEHLLLANSGLLALTADTSATSVPVTKTTDTPLNENVAVPFNGTYLHTYTTTNGTVDLHTTTNQPVVISRQIGAGRVVMIGTDFFTIGTGMDRVLANAVALAASAVASGGPVSPAVTATFAGGVWTGNLSIPFAVPGLRLRATAGTLSGWSNSFDVRVRTLPFGGVFSEDFESGSLDPARWAVTGTGSFRTQVSSLYSPHGGTRHLAMDSISGYARNEATLTLNLSGHSQVVLSFWASDPGDETHGPPASPFTGGADFDGVAISADGISWWEIQGLRALPSTYGKFTIDLDAATAALGIGYTSAFKVRFNQYDNLSLTSDGLVIDDILVTATRPPGALSLQLPAQANEGAGGVVGTVMLASAAPGDLTVALASLSSAKISVPPTVVIPAGQTSATVPLTLVEDPFIDGTKQVLIQASAPGHELVTAVVEVIDNDGGTLGLSFPAAVMENGGNAIATLTLSAQTLVPLTVAISSSLPAAAQVPATVTVPSGATGVTFQITVPDDAVVDGDAIVNLTATAPGWSSSSSSLLVQDNESRQLVVTLPAVFREGDGLKTGTVQLGGTVPADLAISLLSSDTSEITVPASVVVPAGQSSAPFLITTLDDGIPDGSQPFTITASVATFLSGAAGGTVRDNEAHHFTFEPVASPQLRNGPVPAIITARSPDGSVVRDYKAPVTLSATSDSGPLAVTPNTSNGFVNGMWSGSVQINALATNVVLTATDSNGNSGSSTPFNLIVGDLQRFEWSVIPSPQTLDTPFTASVRAVDGGGATATGYNGIANFSLLASTQDAVIGSNNATNSNTIITSSPDSRVHLLYTAAEVGPATTISGLSLNVTSITASHTLGDWTIRLKHTPMANLSGIPTWDNVGWTTVYRASPVISAAGWVTFPFTTNFDFNGTSNVLVSLSMDRTTVTSASPTYVQSTYTDYPFTLYGTSNSINGDPLAWSGSEPAVNAYYQRADIRFNTVKELPVRPSFSGAFASGVWAGEISVPLAQDNLKLKARAGSVSGISNTFNVVAPPLPSDGGTTVFSENFESGTLNPLHWTSTGTGSFRSQVTTLNAPHGGTRHLTMDTTSGYARNEATLTLNLAGRTGVMLDFWAAEFSEEAHGPPTAPFSGGADFDGVAISADGTTWWEIQSLRTLTGAYARLTVNLDAAIAALGISYTPAFKIRFNQYDNTAITSDGIAIDDILVTANPIAGFSLAVPSELVESSIPVTGTVTLDAIASGDSVVSLVSGAPAKLSVPSSVMVLAGQTSATFPITPIDDMIPDGNRAVSVVGSLPGQSARSAWVTVIDDDLLPFSLTLPATVAEGGALQYGTLTLGAAAVGPITVSLVSSDTAELTVPATIILSAGQTVATFPLTVLNDTRIDGTRLVMITATATGGIEMSSTVQVTDNENRDLTHSLPYMIAEGGSGTCAVSLSGTITSDLTVSLASSVPAKLVVPATITIPAGQTSASYTATSPDDTLAESVVTVAVTASAATFNPRVSTTFVQENDVHHFQIPTIATSQKTGIAFSASVASQASNNNTVSYSGPVFLTAAGDEGPVTVVPASVLLSAGSWFGSLTCNTPGTNVKITATLGSATGTSNVFQVTQSPVITVTPPAISLSLNKGLTTTRSIAIKNDGGGTLTWTSTSGTPPAVASASAVATPLATALSNLNTNHDGIRNVIPNRYAFTEGITGTSINDGGSDMYDSGNFLNTNLGTSLSYSDNAIVTPATLGTGGKYFTRKYDGLWVFAADVAGLSYFEITGGLGADGSGFTDSTVLTRVRDGVTFKGFVKRVHGTSDPSVNHVIIIEDNGIATQTAATSTDSDQHRVTGLAGVTRIYYLLYAATSGAYIDNTATQNIMTAFLDGVGVAPWVSSATPSGSVAAGATQHVSLNIDASQLPPGNYSRTVFFSSNDPAQASVGVPVSLTVTDLANLVVTPGLGNASGPRGGPFTPATWNYTLSNTGAEALQWTLENSASWISVSATGGALQPGASTVVTASLLPASGDLPSGMASASLVFTNGSSGLGSTTRTVNLSIAPAAEMAVTPGGPVGSTGPVGGPFTPGSRTYLLTNPGDAPLTWTASSTAPWVSLSPNAGTLAAGGQIEVVATFAAGALMPGSHPATLHFTNTANGRGTTTRAVSLDVTPPVPVIVAEPAFTPGLTNAIAWNAVATADTYEVQGAATANFTGTVLSGIHGSPGHSFAGLVDGTRYHYRVRAIHQSPSGPVASPWSNVVSSVQDAAVPLLVRNTEMTTPNAILAPRGSATDAGSGVSRVTVNGKAAVLTNGSWTAAPVLLSPGDNVLWVSVSDAVVPANVCDEAWIVTYTGLPTTDADGDGLPDSWEAAHGLNPADAAAGEGQLGDPEGDGIVNLLEYALGLDPAAHDASGLPSADLRLNPSDGKRYLTFEYRRRIQRDGLHYDIETTSSLNPAQWNDAAGLQEIAVQPVGDGVTERCTVRVLPSADQGGRKFVRLNVRAD